MTKHKRLHTGELFEYDLYDRKLARRWSFERHERSHTEGDASNAARGAEERFEMGEGES